MARTWTGAIASGSREFTPVERARVLRELLSGSYTGQRNRIPSEQFAGIVGLDGRTVRAILADIDGVECVLGLSDDGVCVAEYQEEAEHWTRVLKSRARAELDRAERRQQVADRLPRRQGALL